MKGIILAGGAGMFGNRLLERLEPLGGEVPPTGINRGLRGRSEQVQRQAETAAEFSSHDGGHPASAAGDDPRAVWCGPARSLRRRRLRDRPDGEPMPADEPDFQRTAAVSELAQRRPHALVPDRLLDQAPLPPGTVPAGTVPVFSRSRTVAIQSALTDSRARSPSMRKGTFT